LSFEFVAAVQEVRAATAETERPVLSRQEMSSYVPPHKRNAPVKAEQQPTTDADLNMHTLDAILSHFHVEKNHTFNAAGDTDQLQVFYALWNAFLMPACNRVCIVLHDRQLPRSAVQELSKTGGDLWTRSNLPMLELDSNKNRPLPLFREFPFRPAGFKQAAFEYLGHYTVEDVKLFDAESEEVLKFLKTRPEGQRKRDNEGWSRQFTKWGRVTVKKATGSAALGNPLRGQAGAAEEQKRNQDETSTEQNPPIESEAST
jgi:hypothetical protein